MKNSIMKKLSQASAIWFSTTIFCSQQQQEDDCIYSSIVESTLTPKPSIVWYVKANKEGAEGKYGSICATINKSGALDVSGENPCIAEIDKRKTVQLVSMIKLLKGTHSHFSNELIRQHIESYAQCSCWLDPTIHHKK